MGSYILSKIRWLLVTLLGIYTVVFLLLKCIPGDPVAGLVGERAAPEVIAKYRSELGLDRPLIFQYGAYLKMVLRGELGRSYYTGREVSALLLDKLPNTLRLALCAMFCGVILGLGLGVLRFFFRGTAVSDAFNLLSLLLLSTPVFWFSLLLILLFVHTLPLVPGVGMGRGEWVYLVLPAFALGSRTAAFLSRFVFAELERESFSAYAVTARAKGAGELRVVFGHLLKNVLIPVVTIVGLDLASYLNGSVLTETIFGWDGLGRLAMDSILRRDYPVILGAVLLGAAFFVLVNAALDLVYFRVDPRVRFGPPKEGEAR